jgi:hypothetical protein
LQVDHLILLDRRFAEVEYADTGVTFLFETPDMHLKLAEHVRQLVNLAVFPAWSERLLEIGRLTRLVRPLASLGGQQVYLVNLDRTRWEHEIALRVEWGELAWPGDDTPIKPLTAIPESEDAPDDPSPPGEPPKTAPTPGGSPDFTLTHERGWTWVRFAEKPNEATREALKRRGFRWSRRRNAWYARQRVEEASIREIVVRP